MTRIRRTTSATRLAQLEDRIAEARRMAASEAGPVIIYADDDDQEALEKYIARREGTGALVVVVRSLAPRPAGEAVPWR